MPINHWVWGDMLGRALKSLHDETPFLAILMGLSVSFQLSVLAEPRILAKETKGKGASSQLVIKNDCRVKDVKAYSIWLTL